MVCLVSVKASNFDKLKKKQPNMHFLKQSWQTMKILQIKFKLINVQVLIIQQIFYAGNKAKKIKIKKK